MSWFVFFRVTGENPFSVGLANELLQLASNQIETVENTFVCLCHVIVARVRCIPRSHLVSTKKRFENCSIEKREPYQPRAVAVVTADPNRT